MISRFTAIPRHLPKHELENIYVNVPSLPEQQKISSLFTSLDNLIEHTELKLKKLKNPKESLLNNMFVDNDAHTHKNSINQIQRIQRGMDNGKINEYYIEKSKIQNKGIWC